MTPRRPLVLVGCVALVLGALLGYVLRGGGAPSQRSQLAASRSLNARLAARLRRTRDRDRRALREARTSEAVSSAYTTAITRELLSAQAGHDAGPGCSSRDFPRVEIRILAPAQGAAVARPVVAHLVVARPFACVASYYLTVDGELYAPVQRFHVVSPVISARHPDVARRVPGNPREPPPGTCFTGAWEYARFRLAPGPHTLAVAGGCAQGTEIPQPAATPVRFTVTP